MNELPFFALGNFYILSADLVDYIYINTNIDDEGRGRAASLRPVGDLEDVSIGLWMMGLQVSILCTILEHYAFSQLFSFSVPILIFEKVFPVHIPEVISDLREQITKPILAIANIKDVKLFRCHYFPLFLSL